MRLLQATQLAYIAGIMDGEGTITINRRRKNYHYPWTYYPQCRAGNTNEDLIHWLHSSTGIGHTLKEKRSKGYKDFHDWNLRHDEISDFLQAILPYLLIKKRQAEIVLEFLVNTRKANRWFPSTEKEDEDKVDLYIEISVLNERGTDNRL